MPLKIIVALKSTHSDLSLETIVLELLAFSVLPFTLHRINAAEHSLSLFGNIVRELCEITR